MKKKVSTKRILGILVPVLILVTTVVMVGVSFAWYASVSTTRVAVLKLTTQPVFELQFTKNIVADNKYNGQTSFDGDGHLITHKWATSEVGKNFEAGSGAYDGYMQDAPYSRITEIKLDTDGKSVDMEIHFDALTIKYDNAGDISILKQLNEFDENDNEISYGFTWYLKKQGTNTVYCPYGKFQEGAEFPFDNLGGKALIEDFEASEDEVFEFCIVFAPEKLFWMQYCQNDWTKTTNEVYTAEELQLIADYEHNYFDKPYYSTPVYTGADFDLSANVFVVNIND